MSRKRREFGPGWRAALLVFFAGGGCASVRYGIGSQPYMPWFAYTEAARPTAFRAAETIVQQLAPSEMAVSRKEYRVTAVINSDRLTRDLLTVEVHARGELMIEVVTELSDGGEWRRGSGVCGSYMHYRERDVADRIIAYASSGSAEIAMAERPLR